MKLLPIAPVDGLYGKAPNSATGWTRWFSEPLVHFVIVGGLLFGAYHFTSSGPSEVVDPQQIELTKDDVRQLAVTWLAQGRPLPTDEQLLALVNQKVTEEMLSREAVALGLDRDDQIIKRRLAQKMDFLVADVAAMDEPSKAQLADWFAKNSERFALPAHMNFRHLYFSPDKRGQGARDAAASALVVVAGKSGASPEVASIGDPFMFKSYYGDATPEQLAKEFGPQFAEALFKLKPESWQGPVQSGYGWHLVWVDSIEPGRIPAFEEIEPDIKSAWLDDRYREVKRNAIEEIRSRYQVVIPALGDVDLRDLSTPQTASTSAEMVSQ